jgi:hypothetical protein
MHQPRRVERYWLCDQWAEVGTLVWTLVHYPNQGIVLVPLRGGGGRYWGDHDRRV